MQRGWLALALVLVGCAQQAPPLVVVAAKPVQAPADPWPSTYRRFPGVTTVIRNATVFDGTGRKFAPGAVRIENGRIAEIGADVAAPAGAVIIDGTGKYITPGIIDAHSHLGVYPSPDVDAVSDGNESTSPARPEVWAEHSVWPQDAGFGRALAGGVTSLHILPGSGNLFGGRGTTLKTVYGRSVQDMKFPGAPYSLKMACGENPKETYGSKGQMPQTRMGNIAYARQVWADAADYKRRWDIYEARGRTGEPPRRELARDTLMGVLRGDILVQNHCYRADEMANMIAMAHEFGYKVATFHHAVESYKIADLLAKEGICSAMWADWYGFKLEAYDGILENVALVDGAGACAIVHSDDPDGIQRLNQEAGKAMAAGNRMGMAITPEAAWRWLAINPAKGLGIDKQTGSLEAGKMADVVLWNAMPLSVYARAERVWIDGALMYDWADARRRPVADFELGQPGATDSK
jgi:imidazolonepropionase-like amidohydrolase